MLYDDTGDGYCWEVQRLLLKKMKCPTLQTCAYAVVLQAGQISSCAALLTLEDDSGMSVQGHRDKLEYLLHIFRATIY
jgi:hypothetical protein